MAERLAACFDRAVEASLAEKAPDDLDAELDTYLQDAHAIEAQALSFSRARRRAPRTRSSRGSSASTWRRHATISGSSTRGSRPVTPAPPR